VLFGDAVVINPSGEYVCERRALTPQRLHILVSNNLSFLTAATFFRRGLLDRYNLFFDSNFRACGDAEWALRLLQAGVRMALLNEFTSAFTETGVNLIFGEKASREQRELNLSAPLWARVAAPLVVAHYWLRRWRAGYYRCRPHDYAIYTSDSLERRKTFRVEHPTYRWRR